MPQRRVTEQGLLKAAVIGAGAFGRHHASKYRGLDGVVLTAIADANPEVRKGAFAAHGVAAVAEDRKSVV